jgi:antitoxin component HigA of HigAB toxin-antitoxin module
MRRTGVPQRELVPIFGTASIVSEVLAGKRELQRKHIQGLADFFQVPAGAFFSAPQKSKHSVPSR